MGRRRGQREGWLRKRSGTWLLTYRDYTKTPPRVTESIGPAAGPGALTKKQAQRFAWDHFLAPLDNTVRTPWSTLTLGQFWERFYVNHLEKKRKFATQSQYKSLWKLWIEPQLGGVRLFELKPLQIDATLNAAIAKEKGSSTVRHIRKVISAVVEHARTLQMFTGDNPAQAIESPEGAPMRKKRAMAIEQCREWLSVAADIPRDPKDAQSVSRPVRTMSLLGICCSLGTSEQLGLTWEHLNLRDEAVLLDGEVLEPRSASIREHSYHGRKGTLKHGHRRRDVPLPKILVEQLANLRRLTIYAGDEDPVFAGADGKPIWADTLQARTMKPLAKAIGLDWISWHIFRHTCATLTKTFGMLEPDRQALMGHAPRNMTEHYTHEDFERMRAVIEKIAVQVTMAPKKKADSDTQLASTEAAITLRKAVNS
jgi:integrase